VALDRVHGDKPFDPTATARDKIVKIIEDPNDDMKRLLKEGLEWFRHAKRNESSLVLKLEGRFGKVLWKKVPREKCQGSFGIKEFEDFCLSDPNHSRIFTPDVERGSADAVKHKQQISFLETFDVKFTAPKRLQRNAIDVRIKFEDGQPKVLMVKKNESKIVVFDVLYLHRNHDVRMALSYYEVMSKNYPIVERLLQTVSLSESDNETITLQPKADEWCVNFIRHKKRETYRLDDKHLVTVNDIRECQLKSEHQRKEPVPIFPDYYTAHRTEIEVHNCSWECAFGRDVGFSPLVLHMDSPAVEPQVAEAIPHPWQPESIMEDFQEFWKNLDALNDMLMP
jgi:hypothetical protein